MLYSCSRSLGVGALEHKALPSSRDTSHAQQRAERDAGELSTLWSGLDEAGWARFMEELERGMAAALRSGAWKLAAKGGGKLGHAFGTSCPRF